MSKVLLPESFSEILIGIAEREHLIRGYKDSQEAITFINDIKEEDPYFNEEEYWQFAYPKKRRNRRKEQQFFQMLFLYDNVLFSDPTFELQYDYSELKKIPGITYLEEEKMSKRLYLGNDQKLDFNFAQYIKPAVIHNVKNNIKSFYRIRDEGLSEYKFASILYDVVYSSKQDLKRIIETNPKFEKAIFLNKLCYDVKREMRFPESIPIEGEFYAALIGLVLQSVEPVLRDFTLNEELDTIILNPAYSVEKLGANAGHIEEISDAYGTLKVECSKVINRLPEFKSIQDTLDFKETHDTDVKRLSSVIEELLDVLKSSGKAKMIEKAASDVGKAVSEINRGQNLTTVDKWTTFLALPASILEYYYSIPPVASIPLGVYGVSSYLKHQHILKKNNWIRIVR